MLDAIRADSQPGAIYLKDYRVPEFLVDDIDLHFELDNENTVVSSVLHCRRNPASENTSASLHLHAQQLPLLAIELDGRSLEPHEYSLSDEALLVHQLPDTFTLKTVTRINPAANTALEGLYHSGCMLCTQCEAEGFRRITFFPDRPDVMSRYRVTLSGDKQKYPVLLSNGNLVASGELDDGRHWASWEDPSLKPSYLFAIVAGDLLYKEDQFTTMSGREVTLRIYVEKENIHKCDHAMLSLQQSMRWDEETYGREYDLDIYMIVAVNDFNMGAMENKGLNIFNSSCVLASPETATDADYYNIQSIIGHEYFHNWSGDRVTCRDWFQLSLKEGFTVYRDQEFSSDLNSRAVKRIDDVNILRIHQFAQDAGPMAHPVRPDHFIEISNFYTVTVYNKGAEVVRMLATLAGQEGFRKGTDLYFSRHDGEAVTTDDFVKAIEDTNQLDLAQFKRWYSQAGTPQVTLDCHYDAENKTCIINMTQTCPATPGQAEKLSFHIPLEIGLLGESGEALPLQLSGEPGASGASRILQLTQQKQVFRFINVPCQPVVSINRQFTAPVKIIYPRSDEELAFLFAHDSDEFNRWDAGQQLAINTMLSLISDYQQGKPLSVSSTVLEAYRKTLTHSELDKALIAQAMTLPSDSYLADQCEVVDVEAIFQVREFLRRTIAEALQQELIQVYRDNCSTASYQFNAHEMARRDLQNVALSYLMTLETDEVIELCCNQFDTANNMTEALAALSQLSRYDIAPRQAALDRFYNKWKHDPQVVEKWLAIQATSPLPAVLQHVQDLMQHEAFSISNPNKVRALIGRFCAGNMRQFHAVDGSGYAFLAEQVLVLDKLNPQIAARLVQNLIRWQRFDEVRQQQMRAQLQRIVEQQGLSRDVYEVASRSLQV